MSVSDWIQKQWYHRAWWHWLLTPLHWLLALVVALRFFFHRFGVLGGSSFPVPVVVVGNISVGGTGKTPVILWLAQALTAAGYKPGIVSRGYGATIDQFPHQLREGDTAALVGDEPLLLSERLDVPVVIDPDRVSAARHLLASNPCNVILSDDGLQHYALARDLEILVIDGQRRFGNRLLLPLGPLREPVWRARYTDIQIANSGKAQQPELRMRLQPECWISVTEPTNTRPLDAFVGEAVTAVAGIGNPGRYFATLSALDMTFTEQIFPDHHQFNETDFSSIEGTVVMTEKDALKCRDFRRQDMWYLKVNAEVVDANGECFAKRLVEMISNLV